jgi:hypothetical protein
MTDKQYCGLVGNMWFIVAITTENWVAYVIAFLWGICALGEAQREYKANRRPIDD